MEISALRNPINFMQKVIGLKLTPYQKEWIEYAEKYKRLSIMAFRGSGKSECFLISYFIFKAFTIKGWQGIIVSCSLPQATEIIKRIRDHIINSPLLRTSMPQSKMSEAAWSKTEIELSNKSRIMCKPFSANIRGYHVDLVGVDEVGELGDHEVFFKALSPLVNAKNGSIIAIGTPTSKVDLLHKLEENPNYKSFRYECFKDKKAIWPERFGKEKLERIQKEIGTFAFSQEYLLKPVSGGDKLFPQELLESALDRIAVFSQTPNQSYSYYMGIDFAMSGKAGADFTVIVVFEKNKEGLLRLCYAERFKGMDFEGQKNRIKSIYNIFKPINTVLDEKTFGRAFLQDLRREGLILEGFSFTNQSKQELIQVLRNMFENKKIVLSYGKDYSTKRFMNVLLEEIADFGVKISRTGKVVYEGFGKHDDTVIGLALAAWGARKSLSGGGIFVNRGSKRRSSGVIVATT